ncbi:uncharacterized protein LOC131886737 [Tigriopus californicus]|uniref:uncharacterized protein LOC131886737 n=1 Tax=Tigriopus californicus TaxID=6832 RepID=UPI0027DA8CB4|nr:uncharacterized protein LOC131886737 [Tigriopus californicus]
MDRLPPEGQSAYLRSCISTRTLDTIRIYMGVSVGATCVTILDSLAEYFTRQSNITLRRVEFSTCKQLEGESFEQFFVRLTLLHENSDPCTHCQEDQMVTRLIAGIEDVELRQKLLAMQKPTVQTLKEACQATESSRIDGHTLEQDAKFQRVLNKRTLSQSGPPSLPFREPFSEARHHSLKSCPGCFIQHDRRACIHRNSTCHHCGKTGHIQPVCYALNRRPKLYTNNESSKNNTIKICAVTSPAPTIVVQVLCQGRSFDATALPDSGADDNLISIHLLNKFGQFKLRPADNRIRAANDSPIQCLGIVEMDVTFHARQIHISAFVTSDVTDFLLSWSVSQQMGLLSPLYPLPDYLSPPPGISRVISNLEPMTRCHQILSQHTIDPDPALVHATKSALVAEFSDVFCPPDDLPPMACEPMDIHLKVGYTPYKIITPRPIPYAQRDSIQDKLNDMVRQKIIIPADDRPSEFVSPMIVVSKKNGDPRICIDYKKLNEHVVRPTHPFPTPKEAIANIPRGARYFSTFDATNGYWQIPLTENAQRLCTFLTPFGRFQPIRAPQGLSCTGDVYNERNDRAFAGLTNFRKMVDDILQVSYTFEEHITDVRNVLLRCRDNKVTLNPSKFVFGQPRVSYVGFLVGR